MKYSGAEIIVKLLEREGIKILPGIPGGSNLPIYAALHASKIKHVLARHEQGAGFIAQGMARTNGRPAACLVTSGPGFTNLITALADANMDSVPLVAISGQVATSLIGTDAFQEVDACGMSRPVTKHNFLVTRGEDLLEVVPRAFLLAAEGRPGAVVIDVPKDVQNQQVEFTDWPEPSALQRPRLQISAGKLAQLAARINDAKRPLLLAGGGVIASDTSELLRLLARKAQIPVTSTLMGLGSFPATDPLWIGMLGMHGARYTNYIMKEIDLLIALGVRFDDRATGHTTGFCPQAVIIHVDIDATQLNKTVGSRYPLQADLQPLLKELLPLITSQSRTPWLQQVRNLKAAHPLPTAGSDIFHPRCLLQEISRITEPETIITTDVGQHQMWTAQNYPFCRPRTLLTSGGLGTMGFGLPAAIGAALANPARKVVCLSGDGSFLMNLQELATLADEQLNVTIVLLNNGHLGLVRQQQELFYSRNYVGCRFVTNPDFAAIARQFGIAGWNLAEIKDPYRVLEEALTRPGPGLIEVPIHFEENVLPIVAPGKANCEMIGE